MILVVASNKDVASVNIAEKLISLYDFQKTQTSFQDNSIYSKTIQGTKVQIVFTRDESIRAQYITEHFSPRLVVFVSRHSGVAGIPTLSVHTPGNIGGAEFGGLPRRVSISPANAMKNALLELARIKHEKNLKYEVSYECTHHGPSLDVPAMFVELGSSAEQWKDLEAAEAVAHASMVAVTSTVKYPVALGIGGPHYSERFTKIALTTSRAFGHIISKYAVSSLNAEMVKQCVQRTVEKVDLAVFDWKSLRSDARSKTIAWLEELGVPYERA